MIPRSLYVAELHAAVARLLQGRRQVTLSEIEELLPTVFARELPGRVSLSKALTKAGWTRHRDASAGCALHVYRAPKVQTS